MSNSTNSKPRRSARLQRLEAGQQNEQESMAEPVDRFNSRKQVNYYKNDKIENGVDRTDAKEVKVWIPKDDRASIGILLFLYVLQGIPLGLAGSIPLILAKKVGYKQQAMFSFVYWPYSVKLLWAPIVDAAYFSRFGRRKTWLVPVQYLIGIFMLILSKHVGYLLGEVEGSTPNVFLLTTVFFCLNFLTATQDIAVDGWALTMLSRENVGWASTCNTVGQTAGYFLGNVVFLALNSPEFCNKYLRSAPIDVGLVELSGFLFFWGIVFLTTTTFIGIFKHEKSEEELHGDHTRHGIGSMYKKLWQIVTLPAVLKLIVILLTCKAGFAAADAVSGLKLVEAGVPKENLAMLAIPMIPVQIILPIAISRFTSGPRPLDVFLGAMPFRLMFGLIFMGCVWWSNNVRAPGVEHFPWYFYAGILLVYALHQVTLYCMFVSIMAFHARISDPRVGGTYMTLLNTLTNLGGNWGPTMALWLVEELTWKNCIGLTGQDDSMQCHNTLLQKVCTDKGGQCVTSIDGYYIESVVCVLIGLLWLRLKSKDCNRLQELPTSAWSCS